MKKIYFATVLVSASLVLGLAFSIVGGSALAGIFNPSAAVDTSAFATTSQLTGYMALTGGTLTGNLFGTNASLSGVFEVTDTGFKVSGGTVSGVSGFIQGEKKCTTWPYEDPTATNYWGRKYFPSAFTVTSVTMTASGSNAAGWTLLHGTAGSITTNLFSANKSASTSSSPTYTSFADATLAAGEFMLMQISSASAKIGNIDVTVCGNY